MTGFNTPEISSHKLFSAQGYYSSYNKSQLFSPDGNGGTRRRTRKRGKKGCIRQRVRTSMRKKRLLLPSIVLANVQLLENKVDELHARVSYTREFTDACVLAFTETSLMDADMDSAVQIDGFGVTVRLDPSRGMMGKRQGGGVCFYI